jgi:hypothetical protein
VSVIGLLIVDAAHKNKELNITDLLFLFLSNIRRTCGEIRF